ncbi:MAG: 2Fe-2S iron-sulfur cluster binding domain-containing protein [Burkholderiales bacterium]|nr:2Fe-2S iron-sulfur cluster binding domain-containing protein [Burkholderiales bacterium]
MDIARTEPAVPVAGRQVTRVTVLPHPELCPDGLVFDARSGRKLVDELLKAGVAIEHACEKVCACATCHVHLRGGAEFVDAADDEEEDQLGDAWGLDPQSRLSCCVRVKGPELVVEMPRFSRNHARER